MNLFSSYQLGPISLKNRVVMAPLTRNRAIGNIPNEIMATYYQQRAEAGLIIAEGTSPSPNGLGYARIPGIFNQEQVAGWKQVTDAVHAAGGKIFVQLMHTGRASASVNLPQGAQVLAPSAITLSGEIYTDAQGMQPYTKPKEMSEREIQDAIDEYVKAAELAIQAGFDGVELHAANGYLIEQFIGPSSNQRSDKWGGSIENRLRFPVTIAERVVRAIGPERVGMRVSPYGVFNDQAPYPELEETYSELAKKLSGLKLAYMHIVDHSSMGAPEVTASVKQKIRQYFSGALILSGNYDAARAEQDIVAKKADLISFGRPFISNPRLVSKLKEGRALHPGDPSTFYTPGPKGYIDYPLD